MGSSGSRNMAIRLVLVALAVAAPLPAVESGSVARDGFTLHWTVRGESGPYVVVLAGGPGLDVDYLSSMADVLDDSYRVVMLEQRGTGRSLLPAVDESTLSWDGYLGDLEALRAALGEEKLTLVGHSWGMTYALAYAGTYPERTRGVVSMGSAPITEGYLRVFSDNRVARLHPSERELYDFWTTPERWQAEPDRALYEYLRAISPTDFWDRAKGLEFAATWRPEWCHAAVGDIVDRTIWAGLDLRSRLDRIEAPVLIVHGRQDVAGEANELEAALHLAHGEVRFVERAGHYPWIDQPQATWDAVLPFLAWVQNPDQPDAPAATD